MPDNPKLKDRLDRHRRRMARAAFGMREVSSADLAAELGTAGPSAAAAVDPAAAFDAAAARGLGPSEALVLIAIAGFAKSGTAAPPAAVATALHVSEATVVQVISGLLRLRLLVKATADVGVGVVPAYTVTPAGATLADEMASAGSLSGVTDSAAYSRFEEAVQTLQRLHVPNRRPSS